MGNLKDYATSTVLTAPSPADSGTSLVVQSGHGARFPAAPFYVTAHPSTELPTLDNSEKLLVTAKSTDTLTITRAQGDTTAKTIEVGWRISNTLFLDDIPDTFDDLTDGTTNKAYTNTEKTKLSGIEALADVTDAANVDAAGATMNADTSLAGNGYFLDEDTMSSDSATKVASQQSIKAYIDAAITAAKSALLPVGSIVILGVSTNPGTLYGFGTWSAITDRVIVGKGSSGTFGTLDATGGVESYNMTQNMLVGHWHSLWLNTNHSDGTANSKEALSIGIQGGGKMRYRGSTGQAVNGNAWGEGAQDEVSGSIRTTPTTPLSTLQPYIVKYMWQRTA